MKPKSISYHKVFNLGNFENEKIGVEIELSEGEDAIQALKEAQEFVYRNSSTFEKEVKRAQEIIRNPDHHSVATYKNAIEFMAHVNVKLAQLDNPAKDADDPFKDILKENLTKGE